MKTFVDFLTEQSTNEMAQYIKRDCQPYLKQGGGVQFNLYRGMEANETTFVHKSVRKHREPMSIPPAVQQFIDKWFQNKFGHPYRRNGLFATGSRQQADEYAKNNINNSGDTYMIYPIGQFSFVWSSTIDDLFEKISQVDMYLHDEYGEQYTLGVVAGDYPSTLSKLQQKLLLDMLNANTFKTTDLKQAAKSGNEVMIACDSYYGIIDGVSERVMMRQLSE